MLEVLARAEVGKAHILTIFLFSNADRTMRTKSHFLLPLSNLSAVMCSGIAEPDHPRVVAPGPERPWSSPGIGHFRVRSLRSD